jgi:hypothetical protein
LSSSAPCLYNEIRWTHTSGYGLYGPTQLFGYHVRDTTILAARQTFCPNDHRSVVSLYSIPPKHTNDQEKWEAEGSAGRETPGEDSYSMVLRTASTQAVATLRMTKIRTVIKVGWNRPSVQLTTLRKTPLSNNYPGMNHRN